jgi:hypothetical protein
MDESIDDLDQIVTKLPKVMPGTVEMVTTHLKPGGDYYLDKLEYLALTNYVLYRFIDAYSRGTTYPDETVHTALLAYSLLEEEAGKVPVITKQVTDRVEEERFFSTEQEFASPILHRVANENPHYFNALASHINTSNDHGMNWITVALMYSLFEKQAELNKLKIN